MLDDFKLEQPILYKTLINSISADKCSHAYILETNGYSKSLDLAIAFAKYLLCPKKYSNNSNCSNCNQCNNIDKRELLELKIIESEGQWIKKSQLEELQQDFSKKSMSGNKQIYIIKDANKLNVSSSNSLLKFLEEPEIGIIAILMVDKQEQLLDTIISRCQVLSLKKNNILLESSTLKKIGYNLFDNEGQINLFINSQENQEKLEKILEFIRFYEDNHEQTIIYLNKLWHDYFKEKDELYMALTIVLLFYKDVLNKFLNRELEFFSDYVNYVNYVKNKNGINAITQKINVIMDLKEKIKFNANNNLLMDKLVICLEGCEGND